MSHSTVIPTRERAGERAAAPGPARRLRLLVLPVVVLLPLVLLTACDTNRPTLSQGDRGPDVTYLQQRLSALNYDVGAVDGVYGGSTRHAVVAFQKVQGVTRDGVAGPNTWAALDRPLRPQARYNPQWGGPLYGIEVDLSRQVTYLTLDRRVVRIIDSATGDGSRGAAYNDTPTGRWQIYRINDTGWEYGPLGALYKPAYYYRGYALHGSLSVPSHPVSHGCVRMTIDARERLQPMLFQRDVGVGLRLSPRRRAPRTISVRGARRRRQRVRACTPASARG